MEIEQKEREIVYGYFYNEIGDYTITRNDEPFAWVSKEKTAKLITGFANKDIQHLQLISGNVSGKELADSLMENAKLEAEIKALRKQAKKDFDRINELEDRLEQLGEFEEE